MLAARQGERSEGSGCCALLPQTPAPWSSHRTPHRAHSSESATSIEQHGNGRTGSAMRVLLKFSRRGTRNAQRGGGSKECRPDRYFVALLPYTGGEFFRLPEGVYRHCRHRHRRTSYGERVAFPGRGSEKSVNVHVKTGFWFRPTIYSDGDIYSAQTYQA